MNGGVHVGRPSGAMISLEGVATLEDAVAIVLHNCALVDRAKLEAWLMTQPSEVRQVAKRRPINKLYRVMLDNDAKSLVYGIVVGYAQPQHGGPAGCAIQILGIHSGAGSYEEPIPVPPDVLVDVTEAAKAGKLEFPK